MADIGLISGLSQNLGYDQRINDLRTREQLDRQAREEAIARAKLYADDNKYNNAMNAFDNAKVKEYATGVLKNISRYTRENPDWEWNNEKRAVVSQMRDSLKNNEHLIRGMSVDNQKAELLKDMQEAAKNPQFHDIEALQNEYKKFDNYEKTGHFEGKVGEGIVPPTYMKPRPFEDLNEVYRKEASPLQADKYMTVKNGRDGAYRTYVSDEALRPVAEAIYNNHKRQHDVYYTQKGIDPIKAIMESLRPYVKTDFHIGEKNRLGEQMALEDYKAKLKAAYAAKERGQQVDPYNDVIIKSNYAQPNPEDLAYVFGTAVPHYYKDANGKLIKNQGDDFHYNGDIFDKEYKTDDKGNVLPYRKSGIKTMPGFFYKDLEWGDDNGFLKKSHGLFGDLEVKPEFKDQVKIVTTPPDKDGKSQKVLAVNAFREVNANSPEYRGKFNKLFATSKQRDELGLEGEGEDIYKDDNGNLFVKDSAGNPIPYKK